MLTVVTGPPCAGKTTHVRDNAGPDDLVLDLDAIAQALGYPHQQIQWGDDHPAIQAARMARAHVLNALLTRRLHGTAWVIDTAPNGAMRAQYQRARAHVITIDPGQDVCLERAQHRAPGTADGIRQWYARRRPSTSSALRVFNR